MERAISQLTTTIVFKIADYFEIKSADIVEKLDLMLRKKVKQ
jgi:hypothetical protein